MLTHQQNTVTIFIASSFEMRTDRIALGDCIRQLDDLYESKGIRIRLNCWEDYTPEYTGERKQDEYNRDLVMNSQIIIGLFKSVCGAYTQEEIKLGIASKGLTQVHCYYKTTEEIQGLGSNIANFFHENNIDALPYRSSVDICQEVTSIIKKYIDSHYTINDSSLIVAPTSKIYATIPSDLQSYIPEVGNIIRQLDHISETVFNTRCRLWTLRSPHNIINSDYYITIYDKEYTEYDIYELMQADTARSIGAMNALAIYSLPNANITGNKLEEQLVQWGHFPIRLESLDILKLNTLIYLISRTNSTKSISVSNFLSLHNGQINCHGLYVAPISALDSLKGGLLTNAIAELEAIKTKMQGIEEASHGKIFDTPTQEYLQLSEKKKSLEAQLAQYTYFIVDFLLKDTEYTIKGNQRLRTLYKEKQYLTIINEVDTKALVSSAAHDIQVIGNRKESLDAKNEQFDIKIRSLLNILIGNIPNEANIKELRTTLNDKLQVQESAYKYRLVSEKEIIRTLYLQIQVADTWRGYSFAEEDILYKKVVTYADYGQLSNLDIENARSNYANALARDQKIQEAAKQYEIAINNILTSSEDTRAARKSISQIYMNYVSCYDAFYDNSHQAVLNRWKSLVEKYILEDRSFIVEMLKIYTKEIQHLPTNSAPHTEQITKTEHILQELVPLFNSLDENDQHDLIHATIIIACYHIDRLEQDYNYCNDKAHHYLGIATRLCQEYEKIAISDAMQYRAQISHNYGFLFSLNYNWSKAEIYYSKSYEDRKSQTTLYRNEESKSNLAETAINYADCLLHLNNYNAAIEYAKEAIKLYGSLLHPEYEYTYMDFYRAKQMLGSIYVTVPDRKEEGLNMLSECWQWAKTHSENKHQDIFRRISYRILRENGRSV